MDNISNYVYRVFRKEELEEFRKSKLFRGNKLDINSGFIHLDVNTQYSLGQSVVRIDNLIDLCDEYDMPVGMAPRNQSKMKVKKF